MEILKELVDLARLSPSGSNRQSLKFVLSAGEHNEKIFSCLSWAGHLPEWKHPEEGERPAAYIVILNDKELGNVTVDINTGIAATGILLGAVERGLGGCMFGAVNKGKLAELLSLPENLEIILVIALGKPKETVVLTDIKDGDIKYYRDENQVHYVPKRKLDEIIHFI